MLVIQVIIYKSDLLLRTPGAQGTRLRLLIGKEKNIIVQHIYYDVKDIKRVYLLYHTIMNSGDKSRI